MAYTGVEGLFKLWKESMSMYRTAVVNSGFDYRSFREDFINSRTFHDSTDACSKNDHLVNLGRIRNLLNYEQVVRRFSSRPLTMENFTECMSLVLLRNVPQTSSFPIDFQCSFSRDVIREITMAANSIPLFTGAVSEDDMDALFNRCQAVANPHLRASVNQHVAYFFSQMDVYGLICRNYQQVIEKNRLIYSSASDAPLSAHNIAQSLDRINGSVNPMKGKIEDLVKRIKLMSLSTEQTEKNRD